MSILNVNTIQPIGSGTTVTVAATELKTSNFITVGTGASVTSPSANVLTLGTNTAERLRITSAGSIGIGTDNPGTKLDVRGGNWSNGDIVVGQSGNAGRVKFRRGADGSDSAFIGFAAADNNSRLSIGVDSGDGTIAFQTNSAERLRITSGGQVIIGDSASDLSGTHTFMACGAYHAFQRDGNTGTYLSIGLGAANGTVDLEADARSGGYPDMRFITTNTERLRVDSSGHVRINTGDLRVGDDTNSNAGSQTISVGSVSSGSGGIGIFANPTNGNSFVQFGDGTSSADQYRGYMNYRHADDSLRFGTANTDRLLIDSSGRVTKPNQPLAIIGTTSNNWSPSAGDTLPFDYSSTNRGNHYNTSNFTFTCPVAGDYMVILYISRKGFRGDLELKKNNSQYALLELRETGRNNSSAADWQAWCYHFIVPCAANDTLKWEAKNVYTGTGGGDYLLDGYNHIYYDSVTYYLMG